MMKKFSMTALVFFCLIFFLSAIPAGAASENSKGKNDTNGNSDGVASQASQGKGETKGNSDTKGSSAGAKSKPNKGSTQSCIAREAGAEKQLSQLFELVTKMESSFDRTSGKLETFYTTKLLPQGKIVDNYDALVKDIADKKTLTQTTKNKTQSEIDDFDCSTGDTKALKEAFRVNMQAVKDALKNYRTAVLNLARAIRQGAQESETN